MTENTKITFLGDFCPINRAQEVLKNLSKEDLGTIEKELENQDLVVANLECPLTDSEKPLMKIGPCLKVPKKTIALLQSYHINTVALANNHIMDYGYDGLQDTINILEKNNISYTGAGLDHSGTNKPLFITIKGRTICMINACEEEFNIDVEKGAGANHFELIPIIKTIEECKSKADYIFLIYHGGVEYYSLPTPKLREKLRFVASLGLTAIICHHTHIVSGFEIWESVPIFYGLGNFLFDWPNKPDSWHIGLNVEFTLSSSGVSFIASFFHQYKNNTKINLLKGEENALAHQELKRLSEIIMNQGLVEQEWQKYTDSSRQRILSELFTMNKWHRRFVSRGLFPNLVNTTYKRNQLFNRFFCESHSELLYHILKRK